MNHGRSQVLVVDDDPRVLSAIQRTLRRTKVQVVTTQYPADALEMIHTREFVAIISDQRMPEIEGVALLEAAKNIAPDPERILITAHPDFRVAIDSINRAKVSHFLTKPWQNNELVSIVEDAVCHYEDSVVREDLEQGKNNAHKHVNTEISVKAECDSQAIGDEVINSLQQTFENIRRNEDVDVLNIFECVQRLITPMDRLDSLYDLAHQTPVPIQGNVSKIMAVHAFKVGVFALKIGQALDYSKALMSDLGTFGFLHDVGMCLLPDVLIKKGKYIKSDLIWLKKHPQLGFDVINRLGPSFKWLANAIIQEHEREDGSGYPKGICGNKIGALAKVIGVVDVYAGLTASRPDREGLMPAEAVKKILADYKQTFCSRVLRAMITALSAFPIESLVRLNSGAVGRVVAIHKGNPLRPTVYILNNPKGMPFNEGYEINLIDHPILYIMGSVNEDVLSVA